MSIKFGPAGLGPANEAIANLEKMHSLGIQACEVSFTYNPYIKVEDASNIKRVAEKLGIQLSIHGSYFINLNSQDSKKLEMSKKRLISCCKVGELIGAKYVVFHPGYYGKVSREETYDNIRNSIKDIMGELKKRKYKIKIAAETMGKINVFGSVDEIKRLVRDTKCEFCLDFAHLLARSNGKMSYNKMVSEFREFKVWRCHFSGIIYGNKGEKRHKPTPKEELKKLLKELPKNYDITIINESPSPLKDSVLGMKLWKNLHK